MSNKDNTAPKPDPFKDFKASLNDLENQASKSDWDKVNKELVPMLGQLETAAWTLGNRFTLSTQFSEAHATRLASVMTRIVLDTSYQMPRAVFYALCRFKRTISQVFEVSGYRGTGHLIDMAGEPIEGGGRKLRSFEIPKVLAFISINALNEKCLQLMMRVEPQLGLSLLMGFCSEQMLYHSGAEATRAKLLASADHWLDVTPTMAQVKALGPAYMGCSYAVAPHKHDIKRAFNSVSRRWLEKIGVSDRAIPAARPRRVRPRILIFAEFYHSTHAMHRCYGASIGALKDRFETVMMIPSGNVSPTIEGLVDRVIEVDFSASDVGNIVDQIKAEEPDLIYYPSVGMRLSSILLSVLRLAPIQVMTFGHPATTKSPAMDYVVLAEDQVGSPDTIDETVVLRPSSKRHSAHSDAEPITPDIRLQPETVRIAVPAWSRKVVPEFLAMCREITEQATKPVEFYLFPNAAGALHQALQRRWTEILPNSVVLPRKNYNDYIKDLNSCDLFLSTFPFGATNGILDASQQGLPIINMKGPEVHTFNDSHLVKRLDQPDWLSVDTHTEYLEAVLKLIDDDGLRVQISRNILAGEPAEAFMVDENEVPTDMAEIFLGLYMFHEEIQASGRHVVHHRDLVRSLEAQATRRAAAQ